MIKKTLYSVSVAAAFIILAVSAPVLTNAAYRQMCDVNNDGVISVDDARKTLRAAVKLEVLSDTDKPYADTDFNDDISVTDARKILRVAVRLEKVSSVTLPKYSQITPLTDNTTAKNKKYARVVKNYAETLPAAAVPDDKSNPLYSPLPADTYDYISGNKVTYSSGSETIEYYNLSSGLRVYAKDVAVETGYALSPNKIKLMPLANFTGSTDLYLKLDWRVPFTVVLDPQSYSVGYDSRPFNLKNGKFTATDMKITFYNTNAASGSLDFSDSGVIKGGNWTVDDGAKTATLTLKLRGQGDFYGYDAYYDSNNYLVIKVKEKKTSLAGMTIMLDPGHGGTDSGAVSGGVYEKNINLSVAKKVRDLLNVKGATVIMTRDSDPSGELLLETRKNLARQKNPDLFISLHCDAYDSASPKGVTLFYYKCYSQPLAASLSASILASYKSKLGYTTDNRGVNFYPFSVTRIENCPSVLIEYGFMTNPTERDILTSSAGQDAMAQGTVDGIIAFLNGG